MAIQNLGLMQPSPMGAMTISPQVVARAITAVNEVRGVTLLTMEATGLAQQMQVAGFNQYVGLLVQGAVQIQGLRSLNVPKPLIEQAEARLMDELQTFAAAIDALRAEGIEHLLYAIQRGLPPAYSPVPRGRLAELIDRFSDWVATL